MKANILAPCIVVVALFLTIGIIGMITDLTLRHLNSRKPVIVSYPCIVVKSDKSIQRADLEMRDYVLLQYDPDNLDSEGQTSRR
jgi:hypothetical protein